MTNILIRTLLSEIKCNIRALLFVNFFANLRKINGIPAKHSGCIKEGRGKALPRAKVEVIHENCSCHNSMVGGKGDRCLKFKTKQLKICNTFFTALGVAHGGLHSIGQGGACCQSESQSTKDCRANESTGWHEWEGSEQQWLHQD